MGSGLHWLRQLGLQQKSYIGFASWGYSKKVTLASPVGVTGKHDHIWEIILTSSCDMGPTYLIK